MVTGFSDGDLSEGEKQQSDHLTGELFQKKEGAVGARHLRQQWPCAWPI